jgi:hypothetical protein
MNNDPNCTAKDFKVFTNNPSLLEVPILSVLNKISYFQNNVTKYLTKNSPKHLLKPKIELESQNL